MGHAALSPEVGVKGRVRVSWFAEKLAVPRDVSTEHEFPAGNIPPLPRLAGALQLPWLYMEMVFVDRWYHIQQA